MLKRYALLPVATHTSELPCLIDLPNAQIQVPLTSDQELLAAGMRAAWVSFAATGNPSTDDVPWPSFDDTRRGMALVAPRPQLDTSFATRHHCAFWAAG